MNTSRQLLLAVLVIAFAMGSDPARADTVTFGFTGGPQSWTVPAGVKSATFDLYGARAAQAPAGTADADGLAARVAGRTVPVVPGAGGPGFGVADRWRQGLSGGGNAGENGESPPHAGSGRGGSAGSASAGGSGGAAGPPATPSYPFGPLYSPGAAGAAGTLGAGGAGASVPDTGGEGGGGGGGLYGGGGGGSGGSGADGGGDGGGGGGGSSLAAKPGDVSIATTYFDGPGNGRASVTFPGSADVRVRLTRSPTRVLRRGDRVTVVALVRARKGKGLRPKIAVKSLRGFRLRSSSVGPSPRCRRVCPSTGRSGPGRPPTTSCTSSSTSAARHGRSSPCA